HACPRCRKRGRPPPRRGCRRTGKGCPHPPPASFVKVLPKARKASTLHPLEMYRLRDAAENFSRTGRGDGAAVIGTLRLVDNDENKIARVGRGEVPHEGRDVLARSDVPVLVLLRGARLARDAQPFDIRLLAAALSDDAFEHGGKE